MPDLNLSSLKIPTAGKSDSPESYTVLAAEGLLNPCGEKIRTYFAEVCGKVPKQVVIISDSNVQSLYAQLVFKSLTLQGFEVSLVVVPAGEASKSLAQVEQICSALVTLGLDRQGLLLALGGGVIGDLTGFVAAVYYRGLPYVQIPTTVVSQADSAIGGKTGVNLQLGKNLVGAFYPPRLVLVDSQTLSTLPDREFNEGFAEVVKHAIIRDPALLDELPPKKREGLTGLMMRNLGIKAAIVTEDEYEDSGIRALLNFGHTVGHAVEQAAGYGHFLHGEAVSIGIHAALRLSVKKTGFPEVDLQRIVQLLQKFHLPVTIPASISTANLLEALQHDKKIQNGHLYFVLVKALGNAFLKEVTVEEVQEVIEALRL